MRKVSKSKARFSFWPQGKAQTKIISPSTQNISGSQCTSASPPFHSNFHFLNNWTLFSSTFPFPEIFLGLKRVPFPKLANHKQHLLHPFPNKLEINSNIFIKKILSLETAYPINQLRAYLKIFRQKIYFLKNCFLRACFKNIMFFENIF